MQQGGYVAQNQAQGEKQRSGLGAYRCFVHVDQSLARVFPI